MIIREAKLNDSAAIAKVHVDTWQATYRGIVPEAYIAKLSYKRRKSNWDNQLSISTEAESDYFVYVAENSTGKVIGFVDGGLERSNNSRYKCEIYAIYILKAYQRKGIGLSLVQQIASRLSQSGLTSMLVWVLADNPASQFYQAFGGQKIYQKLIEIEGIELEEIAYGWNDTKVLITNCYPDN